MAQMLFKIYIHIINYHGLAIQNDREVKGLTKYGRAKLVFPVPWPEQPEATLSHTSQGHR